MFTLENFTRLHVAISLAAIASGFVVVFGMLVCKRLDLWTILFLGTTVATSVTGFGFPIGELTPGIVVGILSLLVLALAIYARYRRHLEGRWRQVYVIGAVVALYLNFFVLVVQSFQKLPALHDLAPEQTEPPFLVAQIVALATFGALGWLSVIRFRDRPADVPV